MDETNKVLSFTDKILLLELYLKHHLQDKVIPDATLYEIAPILKRRMKHLQGVAEILKTQDAPNYLVDAGLFHSMYNGEHNRPGGDVFTREKLKAIVGERAEEIVYQFAMIPYDRTKNIKEWQCRPRGPHPPWMPESERTSDLRWLDIANSMEMKGLK